MKKKRKTARSILKKAGVDVKMIERYDPYYFRKSSRR